MAAARSLLDDLVRAHLVAASAPGRYTLHDLLRVYATECSGQQHSDEQATIRLLDFYGRSAFHADRLLNPERALIDETVVEFGADVQPAEFADSRDAMRWLIQEQAVLTTTVRYAADHGYDGHAWHLAWSLHTFLDRRGHVSDLAAAWRIALDATSRMARPLALATAHRLLGYLLIKQRQYAAADAHLSQAADLYQQAGDTLGQGQTHHLLCMAWWRWGSDRAKAVHHAHEALAVFRQLDYRRGEVLALNALSMCTARLGDLPQARGYAQEALRIAGAIGYPGAETNALSGLGLTYALAGEHAQAIECYQRALDLVRHLGDLPIQAEFLDRLGDARHASGDPGAAREAWRQALAILDELDDPDAEAVRSKLDG